MAVYSVPHDTQHCTEGWVMEDEKMEHVEGDLYRKVVEKRTIHCDFGFYTAPIGGIVTVFIVPRCRYGGHYGNNYREAVNAALELCGEYLVGGRDNAWWPDEEKGDTHDFAKVLLGFLRMDGIKKEWLEPVMRHNNGVSVHVASDFHRWSSVYWRARECLTTLSRAQMNTMHRINRTLRGLEKSMSRRRTA